MSDLAEREATGGRIAEQLGTNGRTALAQLPKEFHEPVAFFWWSNKHLLPSLTPLVLRLKVWVHRHKLTADDVRKAFHLLTDPDVQAGHNFANQLHADLAKAVGEVVREKRRLANTLAARAGHAREKAAAVPDFAAAVQAVIDRAKATNPGGDPPPQPEE